MLLTLNGSKFNLLALRENPALRCTVLLADEKSTHFSLIGYTETIEFKNLGDLIDFTWQQKLEVINPTETQMLYFVVKNVNDRNDRGRAKVVRKFKGEISNIVNEYDDEALSEAMELNVLIDLEITQSTDATEVEEMPKLPIAKPPQPRRSPRLNKPPGSSYSYSGQDPSV